LLSFPEKTFLTRKNVQISTDKSGRPVLRKREENVPAGTFPQRSKRAGRKAQPAELRVSAGTFARDTESIRLVTVAIASDAPSRCNATSQMGNPS
jgi:hypothetical protein